MTDMKSGSLSLPLDDYPHWIAQGGARYAHPHWEAPLLLGSPFLLGQAVRQIGNSAPAQVAPPL